MEHRDVGDRQLDALLERLDASFHHLESARIVPRERVSTLYDVQ